MSVERVDLLIIGAGSAGLASLREARKHTKRLAIVNHGPWGTMCARAGCQPSKLLIEAANAFHDRARFQELGIRGARGVHVDQGAVLRRVRAVRDVFVQGMSSETDFLGEHAISGRARFLSPVEVVIDETRRIRARRIIVATGSHPVVPAAYHSIGARALTTESLFELEALPRRLAVLGQGAVGVELAQAMARLGVEVTAFEKEKLIAGLTDPNVSAELVSALRDDYALHLRAEVKMTQTKSSIVLQAGKHRVAVDAVLVALGRAPNVAGLGLETLGLALDANGLPTVDPKTMRAGKLPVYFAGDAMPLTAAPVLHEARDEGRIAARHALGIEPMRARRKTPLAVVFSSPNAATVGLRFAKVNKARTRVVEASIAAQSRSTIALEKHGVVRLYLEKKSEKVVGAELCGPRVEHLAHLIALAIETKCTLHDLQSMPLYHPTFEETFSQLR